MKKTLIMIMLAVFTLSFISCGKKNETLQTEEEKALEIAKTAISSPDSLTVVITDNHNGTATSTISSPNASGSVTAKYNSARGSLVNSTQVGDVTEVLANITINNYNYGGITISATYTALVQGNMYYSLYKDDICFNDYPAVMAATMNATITKDGKTHTMSYDFRMENGMLKTFVLQVDSYHFNYSDMSKSSKGFETGILKNILKLGI